MTRHAPIATRDHVAVGASQPDPRACGWPRGYETPQSQTIGELWLMPLKLSVAWLKLWTGAKR